MSVRTMAAGWLFWAGAWGVTARGQAGGTDMVVYRPDIVGVGRMFMVALRVPPAQEAVEVTVHDAVSMFDRTPLPTQSDLRKFYFRALKPCEQADITFKGAQK